MLWYVSNVLKITQKDSISLKLVDIIDSRRVEDRFPHCLNNRLDEEINLL